MEKYPKRTKMNDTVHSVERKKVRLTKLEMFYTYVKRDHSSVVEEFERFYNVDDPIAISTMSTSTPQDTQEIPPAPDSIECEDNSAGADYCPSKMVTCLQ